MTQVQHFVWRIKKRQRWDVQTMWAYDVDLWPWRSPRLSMIHVLVLCQSTKCKFRSIWPIRVRHTMWPCDLDIWLWKSWHLLLCGSIRPPSAYQLWSSYALPFVRYGTFVCLRSSACDPDLWPFDLETGAQCSMCHGVPSCQFWWYYNYSFSIYDHWANTVQTDHVTLWPWPLTL